MNYFVLFDATQQQWIAYNDSKVLPIKYMAATREQAIQQANMLNAAGVKP